MTQNVIRPYSELRKMLLIVNPVSGRKSALRYLHDIVQIFSDYGWAVTVFTTKNRGDAIEYARLYADKFDAVTCVGGDGTLNETVCGLSKNGFRVPLGYIPTGSTNDFAACHGISSDIVSAAMNIVKGKTKALDIGDFGGRNFAYISAFGAFSDLSYTTSQNLKNILGHSAYFLDAFKELTKIRAEYLSFKTAGFSCEGNYIFGAVCNTTSVAGTLYLPNSVVDTCDGKFEVLLVHKPNTFADFQSIISGVLNQNYSSPFIDFFQADELEITAPQGLIWSLDGEKYSGSSTIHVSNIHKGLRLIC